MDETTCRKCGSGRMRRYAHGTVKCLDCEMRRARERRRGADSGKGRPAAHVVRARHIQVAAMVGAGTPPAAIARATGYSRSTVTKLIKGPISSDPEFVAIREDAASQLAPQAIRLVEKALAAIDKALDGRTVTDKSGRTVVVMPSLLDQAKALREVANVAGIWSNGAACGTPQGEIAPPSYDMTPEAKAALIKAVNDYERRLREDSTASEPDGGERPVNGEGDEK